MKALFICDNKEDWSLLSKLFAGNFPKIELICAIKGQDALDYLAYQGPFGVVVIDTSMKSDEPNKLARDILDIGGERPFVFLGDQQTIKTKVDDELFQEHEANTILSKPVNPAEFVQAVQELLNWAKEEEFEQSIAEFEKEELLPMRLRNFFLFKQMPYDAYLELTSTKFSKVISKDKPYTEAEIIALSKRNVKQLLLKKDEYLKFLETTVEDFKGVLKAGLPKGKKALEIQTRVALIIHQYLRTVGISQSIIELSTSLIHSTTEVYQSFPNLRTILASFPLEHKDFAEQSILTNYFCQAIIDKIGWKSDISKKKLGLASLLQDCMLSNEEMIKVTTLGDPDLLTFTPQEQEEFRAHPQKAAELCQYFQGFPDTDFIIAQHHELPHGGGFPAGINSNKITALSCTFILASTFVTNLVVNGISDTVLKNTLSQLKATHNIGNFKDPFLALEKTFK